MSSLPPRVQETAEQIAEAHGLEVLEVRLTGGGRRRVLDVVLDADEPVGSEVTAHVAKELSRALDELDPVRGAYTLQVGTPGLDRPLRTARDFRRQLGHEVKVTLKDGQPDRTTDRPTDRPAAGPADNPADRPADRPAPQQRVLQGLVRAVDPGTLTLEVGGEPVELPLADVDHGKVVLPW